MTASVWINTYAGLETPPVKSSNNRYSDNAMFAFIEPPMGSEVLSPDTGTPAASLAATAPAKCTVLRVQLETGKMIAYRVSRAGQSLTAATSSDARIRGDTWIPFGPGDRISVLEVAS